MVRLFKQYVSTLQSGERSAKAMPDDVPLKRCPHCPEGQQWHPATPEFFYRSKNGLHSLCKDCKRSYEKSHRNLPEVKAHSREWHKSYYQKHCSEIKKKNNLPSLRENNNPRIKAYQPSNPIKHNHTIKHQP